MFCAWYPICTLSKYWRTSSFFWRSSSIFLDNSKLIALTSLTSLFKSPMSWCCSWFNWFSLLFSSVSFLYSYSEWARWSSNLRMYFSISWFFWICSFWVSFLGEAFYLQEYVRVVRLHFEFFDVFGWNHLLDCGVLGFPEWGTDHLIGIHKLNLFYLKLTTK